MNIKCFLISGVLKIPPKLMSKCILEAFGSYQNKNPETCLRLIDIVIFRDEMVQDFEMSMKSALKDKEQVKGFFSSMSDWISGAVSTFKHALIGKLQFD